MKKLVLVDLDMTLIDRGYSLTLPPEQLIAAIVSAQAKGVVIGLNSDSNFPTLEAWHDRLGLNGPIISERGSRIWLPGSLDQIETSSAAARLFPDLKEDFIRRLPSVCPIILRGDANKLQAEYRPCVGEKRVIIINDYRERSLSFFARQAGPEGKLVIDNGLLDQAASLLRNLAQSRYPLIWRENDEDNNPDYGIYILHTKSSQKRWAVSELLDRWCLDNAWMVGDSLPDFIDDERVLHVAVANAKEEFKRRAAVTTKEALTGGVAEFLWSFI